MHYSVLPLGCHVCYVYGDLGMYLEIEPFSALQALYLISLGRKVFPGATILQLVGAVDIN